MPIATRRTQTGATATSPEALRWRLALQRSNRKGGGKAVACAGGVHNLGGGDDPLPQQHLWQGSRGRKVSILEPRLRRSRDKRWLLTAATPAATDSRLTLIYLQMSQLPGVAMRVAPMLLGARGSAGGTAVAGERRGGGRGRGYSGGRGTAGRRQGNGGAAAGDYPRSDTVPPWPLSRRAHPGGVDGPYQHLLEHQAHCRAQQQPHKGPMREGGRQLSPALHPQPGLSARGGSPATPA